MILFEKFNLIVIFWIAIAIVMLPILLMVTAPYGRHSKSSWGPAINNKMAWFYMEIPALLVFGWLVMTGNGFTKQVVSIAFLLWMAHYINRTLIFPFRLKTKNKKMPLAIAVMGFFFNLINGFLNGYYLGFIADFDALQWFSDPRFILGAAFFLSGFIINLYSDNQLLRLRQANANNYSIPQGGLFRYISCPNFFGEIIEWAGFAMLTWSLPGLSFFIWTAVNLIPRALDHHKWYKSHFNEYPKERKAIIPWVL